MDLSEYTNHQEIENKQILLSLKEPEEPDEPDLEYNYYKKTSYDGELDQSVHIPIKKKLVKKQIVLDDFEENSSEEEEKSAANIEWREVESVTRQSLCGSDHDKPLSSVDLLEEGINPNDIPKEFPERSCYITIQRIITSWFSSIKAYIDSFTKTNKKNQ
jgi:hypothetical protein